ncbi:hypothetical protein F8568_006655 [Actinomadura sp. LD22]|uniref:Uncharacterized protein n=1 Tax=Actinomadura physcomitrii TaxID=2650748 RepID=A0A6I4MBM7_9ACTN|nr:hypothetical protein [Actinomadura physcomitrii]MWA00059.1 hypothetical protein [Actinomadura physcomitrii]
MIAVPALVAAGLVADAMRLRRRLARFHRLPQPRRAAPLSWEGLRESAGYDVIGADGAVISANVRHAAIAHARDTGLDVLGLIPADLPVTRALDMLRHTRDAGFAAVVHTELLDDAYTGDYTSTMARLRHHDADTDHVVVPCHLTPRSPAYKGRAAWLHGLGVPLAQAVVPSILAMALVLAALAADPQWGPVALIAYCAVPYLVFAGTPLSPRDLHRTALLRPALTPYTWWRTLVEDLPPWPRPLPRRPRKDEP